MQKGGQTKGTSTVKVSLLLGRRQLDLPIWELHKQTKKRDCDNLQSS